MTEPGNPDRHGPAISLVIPSHNRGALILPTIQSALAQTHPFDEIIVVNDGGFPGTRQALAELGPNVKVVDTPQAGAAEARNHGARLAAGPILMLLDDDDILHVHAAETLLDGLLAFPAAKASLSDHTFTDLVTGESRPDHFHYLPHYGRFRALVPEQQTSNGVMLFGRNLHVALLEGNLLMQPWMIWRDVYLGIGGFVSGLGSADDWDIYLTLTRHHKVAVVDRVTSDHYREAGRVHLTTAAGQEQKQLNAALRQLRLAGPADITAQKILRKKLAVYYKTFGDTVRLRDPWQARRHYLQSLRWWPFDAVTLARSVFPAL